MFNHKIITVVFAGDLAHIFYQALSLKKFWLGEPKWTIIVEDAAYTKEWCEQHIVPLMIGWTVDIKTPTDVIKNGGWFRQQHLKMIAAADNSCEWSFIVDAKLFLVKPTTFNDYFDNNQVLVIHNNINQSQSDHHINACALLNKDPALLPETTGLVPYIWKTSVVKELVLFLKDNADINAALTNSTEIALYWCFAYDKTAWKRTIDCWLTGQFGGWGAGARLTAEQFKSCIDLAMNPGFTRFVSLHRNHTVPKLVNIINAALKSLGVINNDDIEFFKNTYCEHIKFQPIHMQESLYAEWK